MAGTNLVIPEELKLRAKIKALEERETLSEIVSRFLAEWVAGNAATPPRETLERFEGQAKAS